LVLKFFGEVMVKFCQKPDLSVKTQSAQNS
jgi:hypothetical protein